MRSKNEYTAPDYRAGSEDDSKDEHLITPFPLTLPDDISGLESYVNERALQMIDRSGAPLDEDLYDRAVNAVVYEVRTLISDYRAVKQVAS